MARRITDKAGKNNIALGSLRRRGEEFKVERTPSMRSMGKLPAVS